MPPPCSAIGLGLASNVAAAAEEPKVLNVYNWSDYIAPDTLASFEKETGIKVRYDNFDTNEIVHAKLVAGRSGYDIVVPSSSWARLQIEAGLLRKLDKARIPNLKNLDPAVQRQLARVDPGNEHLVNWLWGYTTVGVNLDKVKAALGDLPMPDSAWDLIFDARYAARLRNCGISLPDAGSDVLPAVLHALGRPPYSREPADYRAAAAALKAIRPHITRFSSSGYINELAAGSLCAVLGWSGDIGIARQRARDSATGQHIEVLLPKNGALLFFDVMAIPADAPHPQNAHRFIDFILRPQNGAALTNKVPMPDPVPASRPFVRPDVANFDPAVFLSAAEMVPHRSRRRPWMRSGGGYDARFHRLQGGTVMDPQTTTTETGFLRIEGCHEGLRRLQGRRPRQRRHRQGRDLRAARPVGLRQEHPAAHAGRLRDADPGRFCSTAATSRACRPTSGR